MPIMTTGVFDEIRSTDHYEPLERYRIPRRNDIAQRDERGVNPLKRDLVIAQANSGPYQCRSIGTAVDEGETWLDRESGARQH